MVSERPGRGGSLVWREGRLRFEVPAPSERQGIKAGFKKWLSWEMLYRYSSGYGEDYAWAGLVLLILLIGFAGGYWYLKEPAQVLSGPWWKRAVWALLYSVDAATLGRVGFDLEKARLAVRCLRIAEAIVVPAQFGFFLFALRNRFRR